MDKVSFWVVLIIKVIFFSYGGDFAGSLSAWLRQKHPEQVHAAITSGAIFEAQLDFYGKRKLV
jgi:hypothetical protein